MPLSSPGHPLSYPNDLSCSWTVCGSNRRITIAIIEFQTEKGYDFLTIGNGKETTPESKVATLSGTIKIRRVTTMTADAWLQMTSDSSGSAGGFLLKLNHVANIEGKFG